MYAGKMTVYNRLALDGMRPSLDYEKKRKPAFGSLYLLIRFSDILPSPGGHFIVLHSTRSKTQLLNSNNSRSLR